MKFRSGKSVTAMVLGVVLSSAVCPVFGHLEELKESLTECVNHYYGYMNPIPFTNDHDVCTVSRRSIFEGDDEVWWLNGRQLEIVTVLYQTVSVLRRAAQHPHLSDDIEFCVDTYEDAAVTVDWCSMNVGGRSGNIKAKQVLSIINRTLDARHQ